MSKQPDLFGVAERLPEGFVYASAFLGSDEESALLDSIRALPLSEARYRQFTARRRTASYGSQYDFDANTLVAAPPIPSFLDPLREKAARWVGLQARAFVHALVSEYRPGAPLGWHRDVPQFEVIVGVSLGGTCRMRLRPYKPGGRNARQDVISLVLEPRSAYVMRGAARWGWQHCIVATEELRYSITLRTARESHA
jgi:alkylated DNA repair dioxygenase AlkB